MNESKRAKEDIAAVAVAMAAGDVGLLEGCRQIVRLRARLAEPELYDPDLLGIVAIESELEFVPDPASRDRWEAGFLAVQDQRAAEYLERVRDSLLESCRRVSASWRAPAIVDVSDASTEHDLHAAVAAAIGLDAPYGDDWAALRAVLASGRPVPSKLRIRGLDHAEQWLPFEVAQMLECFRDYNNSGRTCSLDVSDDYDTTMYVMRCEARPAESLPYAGAIITCWIKGRSAEDATERARKEIQAAGWAVITAEQTVRLSFDLGQEGPDSRVRQACIDGVVLELHTWTGSEHR